MGDFFFTKKNYPPWLNCLSGGTLLAHKFGLIHVFSSKNGHIREGVFFRTIMQLELLGNWTFKLCWSKYLISSLSDLTTSELKTRVFAGAPGKAFRGQALQMWGLPQSYVQPQDGLAAAHVPAHRQEALFLWGLWQRLHPQWSHGQTCGYSQEEATHTHDMTANGS